MHLYTYMFHVLGRGIPNKIMMKNNYTSEVDPTLLLSPEQAVKEYENAGGNLTMFSQFGVDPLQHYPTLIKQREMELLSHYNFDTIFQNIVNGNQQPFMDGLLCFINISARLTQQVTIN